MPRFVMKLTDASETSEARYVLWSTVVDAPISRLLTRDELLTWGQKNYGANERVRLERSIRIADEEPAKDREDNISGNHAGEHGVELSLSELITAYDKRTDEELPDVD